MCFSDASHVKMINWYCNDIGINYLLLLIICVVNVDLPEHVQR